MSSGVPFTDQEKDYIRRNAYKMSWGHIAVELGKQFPRDNGGHRAKASVRSFIIRERLRESRKMAPIPVLIDVDTVLLAAELGFKKTDLGDILHNRLKELHSTDAV